MGNRRGNGWGLDLGFSMFIFVETGTGTGGMFSTSEIWVYSVDLDRMTAFAAKATVGRAEDCVQTKIKNQHEMECGLDLTIL